MIQHLFAHWLLLTIFLLVQPAFAQPETNTWGNFQFKRLASGDDDSIKAAVQALKTSSQSGYYPLMQALFNGDLYRSENRTQHQGLVIIGETWEDDYGESQAPLHTAYPEQIPILDETGKPVVVPLFDLIKIESGRRIRAMIQPYLTRMELFHPDSGKRRQAAEILGNRGDSTAVSILQTAIQSESNSSIKRQMLVSLSKLQLHSSDPQTRLEAVRRLGNLNDTFVLPLLKARIKADPNGVFPEPDSQIRDQLHQAIRKLEQFSIFMQTVQTIFAGLSLGSVLILVALGLAIIYGQMGVINMAHGEFMMIGAYTTFVIQELCVGLLPAEALDWFFPLSLPFAFLVAGSVGVLLEILVIRHLYSRPLESLLATWGISLILIQAARSIFGDLTAVKLPQVLSGGYEIAPQVILPYNRLFILALTTLSLLSLMAFFYKTRFGLKLRAVTQNRDMSACMGIPVRRVDSLTFLMGTGIAGVAGWAMTLIGNVVPNMGQTYIVDSFLVVVTGGVGKLAGTITAGLGVGLINKILEPIFEAVYSKVLILGLIILFLQSRPTGIFPAKGRNENT